MEPIRTKEIEANVILNYNNLIPSHSSSATKQLKSGDSPNPSATRSG